MLLSLDDPFDLSDWSVRIAIGAIVATVCLIYVDSRARSDDIAATEILRQSAALTSTYLQEIVLARGARRPAIYKAMSEGATNSILGLADPRRTQAQIFWVHQHNNHKHLVSIFASNGAIKQSNNHFSSISKHKADRFVWKQAEAGKTTYYRNIAWYRLKRMPPGFKRFDRSRKYKTFVTAPILVQNSLLGLLTINSEYSGSLSEKDLHVVEFLAEQLSIGAASSRTLLTPRQYDTITSTPRRGMPRRGCLGEDVRHD